MKNKILITAFLMIFLTGGIFVMPADFKICQLSYQAENTAGSIIVNGFVITIIKEKSSGGTFPINIWLTGDNEVKVELEKINKSDSANFTLGISLLNPGDISSSNERGGIASVTLDNKVFQKDGKALEIKKFSAELDFKKHLSGLALAKESEVIAYAQKIYALFEKKDASAVLLESEVKLNDYSRAFGGSDIKSQMKSYLTDAFFKAKLNKIDPKNIRFTSVGPDKKIYHLLNGKDELIKAVSSDGSSYELPVYAGVIDGKLRIIR